MLLCKGIHIVLIVLISFKKCDEDISILSVHKIFRTWQDDSLLYVDVECFIF